MTFASREVVPLRRDVGGLDLSVVTPRTKVRPPTSRPGTVPRTRILDRLARRPRNLLLVTAPAGFGKTTLVSQWAAGTDSPVAWATVTETDSDPVMLISTLIAALEASRFSPSGLEPAGLTGDEPAFSRRVLPAFQRLIEDIEGPITVVVDDIHCLTGSPAATVLTTLVEAMPADSCLALVGRHRPDLPVALWRSHGRVAEIGPDDLAFDNAETWHLIYEHDVDIDAERVHQIVQATHGWPVAVYLEVLAPNRRLPGTAPSAALTEYLDEVVLAAADDAMTAFLGQISILGPVSPHYCNAVLGITDSAQRLRQVERATLLVTRMDDEAELYRLHPLLRERLERDLAETQPALVHSLHVRAARWCEANGLVEEAITHARCSADVPLLGEIVWRYAPAALVGGRSSTVRRWLGSVDEDTIAATPTLSIAAAWASLLAADGAKTVHWSDAIVQSLGPDWTAHLSRSTVEPVLAILVALSGRLGFEESAELSGAAYRALPVSHAIRPFGLFLHGANLVLAGSVESGRAVIEQSYDLVKGANVVSPSLSASTMLAIVAVHEEEWQDAQDYVAIARKVWVDHDLDERSANSWYFGVSALLHARLGDAFDARADMRRVSTMLTTVAPAMPWMRVLAESFIARTFVQLNEQGDAAAAIRRARAALELSPPSPFLSDLVTSTEQTLTKSEMLARLTPAERRLWPHLLGRATLSEVAVQLHLSPATIRDHRRSIYRKLGVTSRRELLALGDRLGNTD